MWCVRVGRSGEARCSFQQTVQKPDNKHKQHKRLCPGRSSGSACLAAAALAGSGRWLVVGRPRRCCVRVRPGAWAVLIVGRPARAATPVYRPPALRQDSPHTAARPPTSHNSTTALEKGFAAVNDPHLNHFSSWIIYSFPSSTLTSGNISPSPLPASPSALILHHTTPVCLTTSYLRLPPSALKCTAIQRYFPLSFTTE